MQTRPRQTGTCIYFIDKARGSSIIREYPDGRQEFVEYPVRKAGRRVQRGDAVGFLRRLGRDPLGACHRPHLIWMPYHLTA